MACGGGWWSACSDCDEVLVLVIGGGITVYVNSVQSSNDALRASKLNQEISSLLLIMSNDIRRAGYWATLVTTEAELNPFNAAGATALTRFVTRACISNALPVIRA